jgi:hypothetical protein
MSVRPSVRMEQLSSHLSDIVKFDIWVFLQYLSIKFKFYSNRARMKVTLLEDQYTFSIISRSVLFRMKTISDKSCREIRTTHFILNNFFNRAFYEIVWKNIIERGRPQRTIWRMRVACWIPKATNTGTGCVILIAFLLQQWLKNAPQCLCYTYIDCLVISCDLWWQNCRSAKFLRQNRH